MSTFGKWLKVSQDPDRFEQFRKQLKKWQDLLDLIKSKGITKEVFEEIKEYASQLTNSEDIEKVLHMVQILHDHGYGTGISAIVRTLLERDLELNPKVGTLERWVRYEEQYPVVKRYFPYVALVDLFRKKPDTVLLFVSDKPFVTFMRKIVGTDEGRKLFFEIQDHLIDQLREVEEIPSGVKEVLSRFFKEVGAPVYTTIRNLLDLPDNFPTIPKSEERAPDRAWTGLMHAFESVAPDITSQFKQDVVGEIRSIHADELPGFLSELKDVIDRLTKCGQLSDPKSIDNELVKIVPDIRKLVMRPIGSYFKANLDLTASLLDKVETVDNVNDKKNLISAVVRYLTEISDLLQQPIQEGDVTRYNIADLAKRAIAVRTALDLFDTIIDEYIDTDESNKQKIKREIRGPYRKSVTSIAYRIYPSITVKVMLRSVFRGSSVTYKGIIVATCSTVTETASFDIDDVFGLVNAIKTISKKFSEVVIKEGSIFRDVVGYIADIADKLKIEWSLKGRPSKALGPYPEEVLERFEEIREVYSPGEAAPRSFGEFFTAFLLTTRDLAKILNNIDTILAKKKVKDVLSKYLEELKDNTDFLLAALSTSVPEEDKKVIETKIEPLHKSLTEAINSADETTIKTKVLPLTYKLIREISSFIAAKPSEVIDQIYNNVRPYLEKVEDLARQLAEVKFEHLVKVPTKHLLGISPLLYYMTENPSLSVEEYLRTFESALSTPSSVISEIDKVIDGIDTVIEEVKKEGVDSELGHRMDELIKKRDQLVKQREVGEELEEYWSRIEEEEGEKKPEVEPYEEEGSVTVGYTESSEKEVPLTVDLTEVIDRYGLWD